MADKKHEGDASLARSGADVGKPATGESRLTGNRIIYALIAACAVLAVIDPLVHKHGPFAIEHWWGFYAIFGFIAAVVLVIAAKVLRSILMKPEDYYDQ